MTKCWKSAGFTSPTSAKESKWLIPLTVTPNAPVKADLANAAKLVDYLDEIDVCEKAVGSSDVPPEVLPLHNAEAMLTNTTKHCCVGPGSGYLLKKLVQMAGAISGGIKKFQRTADFVIYDLPGQSIEADK